MDAELPGGGWPSHAMTEILQAQAGLAEWRLLAPALVEWARKGHPILLIAPPHEPGLAALAQMDLRTDQLTWIQASQAGARMWATEQALKAPCPTAVLSWLPHANGEHIRRLQSCANQHMGPFFVFRPLFMREQASAAALRIGLEIDPLPHPLRVTIIKRKGPLCASPVLLSACPPLMEPLIRGLSPLVAHPSSARQPQRLDPRLPARASVTATSSCEHATLDRFTAARPRRQASTIL